MNEHTKRNALIAGAIALAFLDPSIEIGGASMGQGAYRQPPVRA